MKIFRFISRNIFLILALFFLAFIPLYPKLPLIGINHTWVYIRLEDFFVAIAVFICFIQIFRKKVSLNTPLTIPFLIFWTVGAVSTIFAILFVFPHLANVFPNVAIFNYLRRLEYLSVFFIGYFAISNKKSIPYIVGVLAATLLAVVFYGLGQRGLIVGWDNRFPAFSTMNEEFAKGVPLLISATNRIQSTFAGHYDLAAYLVLIIPVIGSMVFGFKNIFAKIALLLSAVLGLVLLLMTASRISFAVYLFAIVFMLILQKQKKWVIPVVVFSIILLNAFPGIAQRFGSTISQVDVVVDARTGKAIGVARESSDGSRRIVVEDKDLTGENLPQGSGYINIPSSDQKTTSEIIYKKTRLKAGQESTQVTNMEGEFAIRRVFAYDVSFTTRFQGEWPRALEAFKRNVFLGSGYSSISLATDNNYLRILGEVGFLGFASFVLIFLIIAIYLKNTLPFVDSKASKSLVLGIAAGLFGLVLNAIFIDVFEASKVAFVFWILVGIALGILSYSQKEKINYISQLKKILISYPAIILYLLVASFSIFSVIYNNYFIGDDFTWLRWVADCKKVLYADGIQRCEQVKETFIGYFLNSDGFFFRPGTKIYFYGMYSLFWLNPIGYHMASVFFHFVVTSLIFLLSAKILKSKFFGLTTAIFFLFLSAHSEAIFWISVTGNLISSMFILSSLLFYIYWKEKKNWVYFTISILSVFISPLFYELGIVAPILIICYQLVTNPKELKSFIRRLDILYILSIPFYLVLRFFSKSHWLSGDYSYRLSNLIYNLFGNLAGYFGLTIFGSSTLYYYDSLRNIAKQNYLISFILIFIFIAILFLLYKIVISKLQKEDFKILLVGIAIFVVGLLPFIALGNISIRYDYLASFGVLLIFVFALKKLYILLAPLNKYVAMAFILLIISSYSMLNIRDLNRVKNDWKNAGDITNNLQLTFYDIFPRAKATPPNPVFYFFNVPIKTGEAWIFPVGLKDALWFTFQNDNLTVHTNVPMNLALDAMESSTSARVYEFDKDGNISVINITRKTSDDK